MEETLFTVGHSTHPRDRFIALLERHGITALCDVRSKPYSRMNPQFNKDEFRLALKETGIPSYLSFIFYSSPPQSGSGSAFGSEQVLLVPSSGYSG